MKRALPVTYATGAVTVALFLCMLIWRDREDPERPRGRRPAPAPAAVTSAPGPEVPSTPTAEKAGAEKRLMPEPGAPGHTEWVLAHCGPWLEARGRDATGLLALWDLCGEESLLREAAEKSPDDPRLCVAMIGIPLTPESALLWAERLAAAAPENPAGPYWKAALLAKEGRTAEALAALRAGTAAGGDPDWGLKERAAMALEAALAGGVSARDAVLMVMAGPVRSPGPPVLGAGITEAIDEARRSGNEDRLVETAGAAAAAAEHLLRGGGRPLLTDMMNRRLLLKALEALPPETEYGNGDMTAGRRLERRGGGGGHAGADGEAARMGHALRGADGRPGVRLPGSADPGGRGLRPALAGGGGDSSAGGGHDRAVTGGSWAARCVRRRRQRQRWERTGS